MHRLKLSVSETSNLQFDKIVNMFYVQSKTERYVVSTKTYKKIKILTADETILPFKNAHENVQFKR